MSDLASDQGVMTLTRYKHEFQKASGSREMVEHDDGDWVRYEDVQNALVFATAYLSEHKGMLEDLKAHPNILTAVQYIISEIERL